MSNNYQDELVISQLTQSLTWEEVLSLLPDYPGPDVIPDANAAILPETARTMLAFSRSASVISQGHDEIRDEIKDEILHLYKLL